MQRYAVNFIPLLSSLYMFQAPHTPIIRSKMFNCIYSHLYKPYCKVQNYKISWYLSTYLVILYLTVWFVPVTADTVEHCTPDEGRVWRPKHVEWT